MPRHQQDAQVVHNAVAALKQAGNRDLAAALSRAKVVGADRCDAVRQRRLGSRRYQIKAFNWADWMFNSDDR